MAKKAGGRTGFMRAISDLYPGLIKKARETIEASEKEYERWASGNAGSFLWEHTLHVASLAYELAIDEGFDPVLPSLAALFHDAGKFAGGVYHRGRCPEEEDSAALAGTVLGQAGALRADIAKVRKAIRALYDEKAGRDPIADLVHDADFLSKFGYLGIANFFIKSTLRGRNLNGAIMNSLSKELTYASALPSNMRTGAGRRAAVKKARDTQRFFRELLRELKDTHGVEYRLRKARVAHPGSAETGTEVRLVVPAKCESCGGWWRRELAVEKGVKCLTLDALLRCSGCGDSYTISFCLPEVPPKARSSGRRP
jgi:uncharacterized protein